MSQTMEIVSNFQHKKIGLNVRRNGPQPSIFVRSFSPITICLLNLVNEHPFGGNLTQCSTELASIIEFLAQCSIKQ